MRWWEQGRRAGRAHQPPAPRPPQLVRYSAEGLLQLGPLGSTAFLPDSKCLVDDGRGRAPALKTCEDVARPAQRLWDFTQVSRAAERPPAPPGPTWGGATSGQRGAGSGLSTAAARTSASSGLPGGAGCDPHQEAPPAAAGQAGPGWAPAYDFEPRILG